MNLTGPLIRSRVTIYENENSECEDDNAIATPWVLPVCEYPKNVGALERLGDPYIEDGILELKHVWANSPPLLASESPPPVRLPDLSTA